MHQFLVCMYILQDKSVAMVFVYQKINALRIFFFLKIWPHCPICILCMYVFVISPFATPWTVAHQASLSVGFSRQEYWSELSFPPPADLPDPEIELVSLASPALAGGFFTSWATAEAPALCGDFTILHLQKIYLRLPGSLPCQQNSLLNFGMCHCDEIDYSLVIFICIFLFMSEVEYFFIWLRAVCILLFDHALCHQFLVLAMPLFKGKLPAWLSIAQIHYSLLIQFYF